MIYCFTGTGNSLWAAKELGKILKTPVEGLIKYRNMPLECPDDMVGFVLPTYMGDIPWIVKEILVKVKVRTDSYVFLVMTSNNGQSGRSFQSVDEALQINGGHLCAGFNLQMPGNCLISSAEENQKRLAQAPSVIKEISETICKKYMLYEPSGKKAENGFVEKSYFYGTHSLKRLTLMKNFRITKDCIGCGVCASVCPTDNIVINDGKAVHKEQCAACYACLHWCPKHAVKLKVPTLSKRPQYHHPEISLQDVKELKEGEVS